MKRNQIAKLLIVSILSLCWFTVFGEIEVKKDKENVVASRLIGIWRTSPELSQSLLGGKTEKEHIVFFEDKSIPGKLPVKYTEFLKGKQIYLAGFMTRKDKQYPFILISHKGNPHLIYFREKNGDLMGDGESFNLVITPAKDKGKDLLFIGGDFNNQPFSAFERQI